MFGGWAQWMGYTKQCLHQTNYLARVPVLIVVPTVQYNLFPVHVRVVSIDAAPCPASNEIGGDPFGPVTEIKDLLKGASGRSLAQETVDFLFRSLPSEAKDHNGHRNVRGRNTDGARGELTVQVGHAFDKCLGGPCFRQDHVQRGGPPSPIFRVHVVDQVLVVRKGVHGLDVTGHDSTKVVVDQLDRRNDGVGRARRGRKDVLVLVRQKLAVVDAVYYIGDVPFPWRRQQDV